MEYGGILDGTDAVTFNEDEIVRAFEQALLPDDEAGALTVSDLAARLGRGEDWVRRRLRILVGSGKWECVFIRRNRLDGINHRFAAYRPKIQEGVYGDSSTAA